MTCARTKRKGEGETSGRRRAGLVRVSLVGLAVVCGCELPGRTSRSSTSTQTTTQSTTSVTGAALPTVAPTPPVGASAPPPPSDLARPADDAVLLRPGVSWRKDRQATSPARAEASDQVRVSRVTWDTSGAVVTDTFAQGAASAVEVSALPTSLQAVILQLAPAETATVWVEAGVDGPGSAASVHHLLLVDIVPGRRMPKLDADAAKRDPNAKATGAGVSCKELRAGTGRTKPSAKSTIRTVLDCYTLDGRFFEGNARGDGPSEGPLASHPAKLRTQWAAMTIGEQRRCWFPPNAELGFGEGDSPELVCDATLLGTSTR